MSKDSKRSRRLFSTEQKVAILRRHLVDKVQVSDLCDEYKPARTPSSPKSRPSTFS